jgi:hypothetical protein
MSSSSDPSDDLKINENETLAALFARVHPSQLESDLTSASDSSPDTLKIKSGRSNVLEVSFMRTVRVPDNGRTYNLPPALGRFPLFNIASFTDRLPPEMISKGGILFPIYRE